MINRESLRAEVARFNKQREEQGPCDEFFKRCLSEAEQGRSQASILIYESSRQLFEEELRARELCWKAIFIEEEFVPPDLWQYLVYWGDES